MSSVDTLMAEQPSALEPGESFGDPKTDAALCAAFVLRRATRLLNRVFDQAMAPAGVTSNQFSILTVVKRHPKATISALSGILLMERSTVLRNVDTLQRAGLVAIEKDVEDARRLIVKATQQGLAVWHEAWPLWQRVQSGLVDAGGGNESYDAFRLLIRNMLASTGIDEPDFADPEQICALLAGIEGG